MFDNSLLSIEEKHISDAKLWAIMIIVSAALLLVSGIFVRSANPQKILAQMRTLAL